MADSDHLASNPLAQTATPGRVLPEGTSGIVSFGPPGLPASRSIAGGGEGNCPLWDGHIIDATFPLV